MAVKSVTAFLNYLKRDRGSSENTIKAYERDLNNYSDYLKKNKIRNLASASHANVQNYIDFMMESGKANGSVVRALSSIRSYYQFLTDNKLITANPADNIRYQEVKRKALDALTDGEMSLLLAQPDCFSPKGIRDKAILELLYATGMQVNELLELNVTDINLSIKTVVISRGNPNERILPLYPAAADALRNYIHVTRPKQNHDNIQALFLNSSGNLLTRQGVWKIINEYSKAAGINHSVSPQMIRVTFINQLFKNGADVKTVQEMAGHSDIVSTRAYARQITEKYAEIYSKFREK